MMLCVLAAAAILPTQSLAVYRMPVAEGTSPRMEELLEDEFDGLCVDPEPTLALRQMVGQRLKFVSPSLLDTAANRKWRDATIAFANGRISPAAWVSRTKGLGETYHWLSSPSTPSLRDATPFQAHDVTFSGRSVFAEMVLLGLPGRVCLTSSDCWLTRTLPEAGRLQSWVLAMNDFRGPFLSLRKERPELRIRPLRIVRADRKPGMLVAHLGAAAKGVTVYFNNSGVSLDANGLDADKALPMGNGFDMEGKNPRVRSLGMVIVPD